MDPNDVQNQDDQNQGDNPVSPPVDQTPSENPADAGIGVPGPIDTGIGGDQSPASPIEPAEGESQAPTENQTDGQIAPPPPVEESDSGSNPS
jgi:hypothetical protein